MAIIISTLLIMIMYNIGVGAMSAVHTVTVVSVSVAVRTSLLALTQPPFNTARVFVM